MSRRLLWLQAEDQFQPLELHWKHHLTVDHLLKVQWAT
jgi:hypothetical protein